VLLVNTIVTMVNPVGVHIGQYDKNHGHLPMGLTFAGDDILQLLRTHGLTVQLMQKGVSTE
jgi:hypothetical protein